MGYAAHAQYACRVTSVCSLRRDELAIPIRKDTPMAVPPYSLKTPIDILEAALAREQEAHAFYAEALRQASSAPVRELLEQLKDAEYKHVQIVEKKLAQLR